jgi:hypothetical protein
VANYSSIKMLLGYSTSHIGRPGCPWHIVDTFGAIGKKMDFSAAWAFSAPSSPATCNGAKISYVAARSMGSNLYSVVGAGTAVGGWTNGPFGGSYCAWYTTSGNGVTTINNSPYDAYRILLRAWEANGTERTPAGYLGVNFVVE